MTARKILETTQQRCAQFVGDYSRKSWLFDNGRVDIVYQGERAYLFQNCFRLKGKENADKHLAQRNGEIDGTSRM